MRRTKIDKLVIISYTKMMNQVFLVKFRKIIFMLNNVIKLSWSRRVGQWGGNGLINRCPVI